MISAAAMVSKTRRRPQISPRKIPEMVHFRSFDTMVSFPARRSNERVPLRFALLPSKEFGALAKALLQARGGRRAWTPPGPTGVRGEAGAQAAAPGFRLLARKATVRVQASLAASGR